MSGRENRVRCPKCGAESCWFSFLIMPEKKGEAPKVEIECQKCGNRFQNDSLSKLFKEDR